MKRRWWLVPIAPILFARSASAQDHFEPAERGSEWLAADSLDLRGNGRANLGVVTTFAHEPGRLSDQLLSHVGGGIVLADRLRLSLDLPFELYASSRYAPDEAGIGDARLAADARLFGIKNGVATAALGVVLWAPTGGGAFVTEDVFRAMPRASIAGVAGRFTWAAQAGVAFRRSSELVGNVAAGLRFSRGAVVVGPEAVASAPFDGSPAPVEVLFGAHWLVDHTARFSVGAGAGIADHAPGWRAIVGFEWAPAHPNDVPFHRPKPTPTPPPLDGDHDGIPDFLDACPLVVGVPTADPKTNGCPPDADGDGFDDLVDACPTVKGIAPDGCPDPDRDHDGIPNEIDACPDDRGTADIDPRRNGCPRAFVREDRIVLLDQPKMDHDALGKDETTQATLTALLAVLLKLPETQRVKIEGHTDDRENVRAGAARAAAVAKWLGDHGIAASRIVAEGVSGKPIDTNETAAGRAENRRVELHLLP